MKKTDDKKSKRRKGVVLLRDLVPRKEVAVGSGQILFGQDIHPPGEAPKKERSQT